MINNETFLKAIFKDDYKETHVTSFKHDPNNIPEGQGLYAWKGDKWKNIQLEEGNQYFTISLFNDDDKGDARRRAVLYKCTPCIVLDDVREKLDINAARRLPQPSWILETSEGSEQWGYILTTPATNRSQVENLLDGLVANGLSPTGKDPGMKGVTRYVRLPDGTNNKSNKLVNGAAFNCLITAWNPERTTTLEALALPFMVDLNATRRSQALDGAANVPDHPLLQHPDVITIKEVRDDGRFDIYCPWTEEHTNAVDNGAAMFTNKDGTMGFKCHHGACEGRTGRDFIEYLDEEIEGFSAGYKSWQTMRSFQEMKNTTAVVEPEFDIMAELQRAIPGNEQNKICELALQHAVSLSAVEKISFHKQIKDVMSWTESDLKSATRSLKKKDDSDIDFYNEVIFVAEQNQFYNRVKRIWYTPESYANSYSHLDTEARKEALQGNRVVKVDKLDYAPKMPPVFEQDGIKYGNGWDRCSEVSGKPGDVQPWLDHFEVLGWTGEFKKHTLQWIAHTILYPEIKINHMLLLGSGEGCGKDWLLYPLVKAMGRNHCSITADDLLSNFNEYILSTKHLHINELEIDDDNAASLAATRIKPLCAAPPEFLRTHDKGRKKVEVRNILNLSATTNSHKPVKLNSASRRIFALWSNLDVRNQEGQMSNEWRLYWRKHWPWMISNWEACVHYLRTEVDLSDFYPGEAPPATEFLKGITEKPMFSDNVISFM